MDWTGLVQAGNQGALQWYAMVTGKPLPGGPEPAAVIEVPSQVSTLSVVAMLAVVVVGAVLIFRR